MGRGKQHLGVRGKKKRTMAGMECTMEKEKEIAEGDVRWVVPGQLDTEE